jgi:hypothetical protein
LSLALDPAAAAHDSVPSVALEHVAQGQTRIFIPGVTPDARGILLGKFCVLTFSTVEGAVSWLRLYSAEASLDELLSDLTITKATTALGTRDILLRIPAVSSHAADRAARITRLLGGEIYTGSAKHFVKYRDDRSPYGYDVLDVGPAPPDVDTIIYGDDFIQSYKHAGELPFDRLLFRLSLRRLPGSDRLVDREDLMLVVERGLAEGIVRYFWRNRVTARTGLFAPQSRSAFDEGRSSRGYMLFQVSALPERMLKLFLGTPGVDVFRPRGPNAAVAVGYQHPIDLTSCSSIFGNDKYHLFWPGDRVDILPGPLELVDIADLTKLDIDVDKAISENPLSNQINEPIAVDFKLVNSTIPSARVVGTLIDNRHRDWLKRLLYALPPALLRGQRIAVTDRGILVVTDGTASKSDAFGVVPLGQPLKAIAPGLLVPVGLDVVPRVAPDVLARALGHAAGSVTVLVADGPAFRVADSALAPLERRSIAKLEIDAAEVSDVALPASTSPNVVNDPIGRFSLWGFPDVENRKLLPSSDGNDKP